MYFFLQIHEITRFFSCLCIFIQQIFSFFYKKAENVFVYMFLKKLGFFKKNPFFALFSTLPLIQSSFYAMVISESIIH